MTDNAPVIFDPKVHVQLRSLHRELLDKYDDDNDQSKGYDWMFYFLRTHDIPFFTASLSPGHWRTARVVSLKDAEEVRRIFVGDYKEWRKSKNTYLARQVRMREDNEERLKLYKKEMTHRNAEAERARKVQDIQDDMHLGLQRLATSHSELIDSYVMLYKTEMDAANIRCANDYERRVKVAEDNYRDTKESFEEDCAEKISALEAEGE